MWLDVRYICKSIDMHMNSIKTTIVSSYSIFILFMVITSICFGRMLAYRVEYAKIVMPCHAGVGRLDKVILAFKFPSPADGRR